MLCLQRHGTDAGKDGAEAHLQHRQCSHAFSSSTGFDTDLHGAPCRPQVSNSVCMFGGSCADWAQKEAATKKRPCLLSPTASYSGESSSCLCVIHITLTAVAAHPQAVVYLFKLPNLTPLLVWIERSMAVTDAMA